MANQTPEMTKKGKPCVEQPSSKSCEVPDDELDRVAGGTSEPINYGRLTNGVSVRASRVRCDSERCAGSNMLEGTFHIISDTQWSITCKHCGWVYYGSGDPADQSVLITTSLIIC